MKSDFPGYYRPSLEEFAELWAAARFIVDANVLLDIYGYSEPTRNDLLGLLESIKERLWIPYQFALEYQRGRAKVILQQIAHYKTVSRQLRDIRDQVFLAKSRHPFVTTKSFGALRRIMKELDEGEAQHVELLKRDPYFDRVTAIFEGRVGPAPAANELRKLCDEAEKRYRDRVPPGYLDQDKESGNAFGDFIGWRQLLDYGRTQERPLILITNDQKADWWLIQSERRLGPRPELIAECLSECDRKFYLYTLGEFMERGEQAFGRRVGSETLLELREQTEARMAESGERKHEVAKGSKAAVKPKGIVVSADESRAKGAAPVSLKPNLGDRSLDDEGQR